MKSTLKSLINTSVYGVINHIHYIEDLEKLESFIIYNLPILKEFKAQIVATNYSSPLQKENEELWRKYFPNILIKDSLFNRGHNFGTVDLDDIIFRECDGLGFDWLCKTSADMIFDPSVLDIEIDEGKDFYYMNGVGYGGMREYDFNIEKIISESFFPQTNFYFINTSKVDFLNDKQYINETYEFSKTIPKYNGKIWEYIDGWSCENFLKQCTERNKLSKGHLIPKEKYKMLLETIKFYQIHDPSYKNLSVEGICHHHFNDKQIIII